MDDLYGEKISFYVQDCQSNDKFVDMSEIEFDEEGNLPDSVPGPENYKEMGYLNSRNELVIFQDNTKADRVQQLAKKKEDEKKEKEKKEKEARKKQKLEGTGSGTDGKEADHKTDKDAKGKTNRKLSAQTHCIYKMGVYSDREGPVAVRVRGDTTRKNAPLRVNGVSQVGIVRHGYPQSYVISNYQSQETNKEQV